MRPPSTPLAKCDERRGSSEELRSLRFCLQGRSKMLARARLCRWACVRWTSLVLARECGRKTAIARRRARKAGLASKAESPARCFAREALRATCRDPHRVAVRRSTGKGGRHGGVARQVLGRMARDSGRPGLDPDEESDEKRCESLLWVDEFLAALDDWGSARLDTLWEVHNSYLHQWAAGKNPERVDFARASFQRALACRVRAPTEDDVRRCGALR